MLSETCKVVYLCPSTPKGNCAWEGDASDILEHFQNSHRDLLMDTNTIKVDITKDSEQNRIMGSEKGLFLVQIKVCLDANKFTIRLRFLDYDRVERLHQISYNVEVSLGKFGFVNERNEEGYCPVYNCKDGVEVDFQAISLMSGISNIKFLLLNININEEQTEEEKEENSKTFVDSKHKDADGKETNPIEYSEDPISIDELRIENKEEEVGPERESNSDETIKCTNCKQNMIPPIYMCPDGHSVCYHCKGNICKICDQAITELRNIDLEEHSKTLSYSCRYENQGCREKFRYDQLLKHEISCEYYLYKCEECSYECKLSEIKSHFRIYHPSIKIQETMIDIPFRKGSTFVIINNDGVFYCTSRATETYVEWQVVFSGPKERYFSCEVRLTGKKQYQYTKNYFLDRNENIFRWTVPFDQLKNANVKEKYAKLFISSY